MDSGSGDAPDIPREPPQPDAYTGKERLARLLGLEPDSLRLEEALTHPSYANERQAVKHNQRLEFLGDAVLGFCVSEALFERFPEAPEGLLTRLRAQLVNGEALAVWARSMGLRDALRFGRGAQTAGLDSSNSVLADAVEAVVAAVYLEKGLEPVRALCAWITEQPLQAVEELGLRDPKSELQERLQAKGRSTPAYTVVESGGPAHKRWFRVQVAVDGEVLGEGLGQSKRSAERIAAAEALERRESQDNPGKI